MIQTLEVAARAHGDRLALVRVERLATLREALRNFRDTEDLNGFQQHIIDKMYMLDIPDLPFVPTSILIVAAHHPLYSRVVFEHEGRDHACMALTTCDQDETIRYLAKGTALSGRHIHFVPTLPMKRLAVQSGLARYGRNNVAYVEGLGSQATLMAFFPTSLARKTTGSRCKMRPRATAAISACAPVPPAQSARSAS